MRTSARAIVAVLVVMGILFIGALPAAAVPPLPSSFYGTINGEDIAVGDPVTAEIGGVTYAWSTVLRSGGDIVYALDVPGDDPTTTGIIEGGVAGQVIVFRVNGKPAEETALWQSGTNLRHDLTVTREPTIFHVYLPFVSK